MSVTEKRTRELMSARGVATVAELAERSGVNRSHIYALWKDGDSATVGTVRRIARALRVSCGQFIGDEPAPVATLYDTHPEYRDHLANLEALSEQDRDAFLRLTETLAAAVTTRSRREKRRQIPVTPANPAQPSEKEGRTDMPKHPITMR